MRAIALISLTTLLILGAPAAQATFIPENLIYADAPPQGPSNTDETKFRQIISTLQATYGPLATAQGGHLSFRADWASDKLNAGSQQVLGQWMVQITGGLARRPELTSDAFTLILCHELGHHFGGFAFSASPIPVPLPGVEIWAANEGEADYFSTQVCSRKVWGADTAVNAGFRQSSSRVAREKCDSVWTSEAEQNVCYRVLTATESLTATMAAIMKVPPPTFDTPDPAVVGKTKDEHPAAQCRMDTILQGALCRASFDEHLIPGKKVKDPYGLEAEHESARTSCTVSSNFAIGLRPACWYKARL